MIEQLTVVLERRRITRRASLRRPTGVVVGHKPKKGYWVWYVSKTNRLPVKLSFEHFLNALAFSGTFLKDVRWPELLQPILSPSDHLFTATSPVAKGSGLWCHLASFC
jgi:hypothetical protein